MKKRSICLWALVALLYVFFIGIMSYWYPVTLDEYFRWGEPFRWEILESNYLQITPRISTLFAVFIFALGKWSFVVLNPLIQLLNCLCMFYILFVRFPNITTLKDMSYFIMILFMSIFFVCMPSQVMFWVSGAINYTWMVLFLLLMLCFLRQVQVGKVTFKDNWFMKCCLFLLGFTVGMSNESFAPLALGGSICFALFCEYKKIKVPRSLSFLIFGLAMGCLAFFSSPAHYNKMSMNGISNLSAVSFSKKIFFHISHLNDFFSAQFYLFFLTAILLFIAFLDKDRKNVKKEDLWTSLCILLISLAMAVVLFVVPRPPVRAFYPASVLCIISFLLLVKYYINAYNFDFSKWLCYVILIVCLFLSPRFILPHYSLYIQDGIHKYLESFPKPIIKPYIVLKGPTSNLSIGLIDPARRINIGNDMYFADVSPLTNW